MDGYGEGPGCLGPDCNDGNFDVNPGQPETCGNGIDDNCSGGEDEGCAPDCIDDDGDGYGEGPSCIGEDCDDSRRTVNPGHEEVCHNDRDDNCDGNTDEDCGPNCVDNDGDGYGEGPDCDGADCDDSRRSINPGADEVCGNGRDDDCDRRVDEDCEEDPPCGELLDCLNGCGTAACQERCWSDRSRDCEACLDASYVSCWSNWCPDDVVNFTDCRRSNNCDEMFWDDPGTCTQTRCGDELLDLNGCIDASGVSQADYDRLCAPAENACVQ